MFIILIEGCTYSIQKSNWLVKENTNKAENISIKYFTYNKEIGYADYINLKDYEILDNLDEISLMFQPVSPVVFHIKNNVLNSLKYNQFSSKQSRTATQISCIF